MSATTRTYTDRFGYVWAVRVERNDGMPKRVTFTCGNARLVVTEEVTDDTHAVRRLKDLFCDAERVLAYEEQEWYVGYRSRTGKGGRVQNGLHTRFRSATGEVWYAREMLQFRQMAEETLCKHLASAKSSRVPNRQAP